MMRIAVIEEIVKKVIEEDLQQTVLITDELLIAVPEVVRATASKVMSIIGVKENFKE